MNRFNPTIQLPHCTGQQWLWAIMLFLLPNILFLLACWTVAAARPLINLDYLLPALLAVLPIRGRKIFASIAFWPIAIADLLMLIMQLFPFMDLAGVVYLTPFLFSAPWSYQLPILLVLAYIIVFPMLFYGRLAAKTHWFASFMVASIIFTAAHFTGHLQYHERHVQHEMFGQNNFYYAASQTNLYLANQEIAFLKAGFDQPIFSPLRFERQSVRLDNAREDKVLLIILESLSEPRNPALFDTVIQPLTQLQQQGLLQEWESGFFPFDGATVEGEMRELCHIQIRGYALRNTPVSQFDHCLPRKMQAQNRHTIAMHGASGRLYDRFSWYEKAGFKQTLFPESPELITLPRCSVFSGVCDDALFDVVEQSFARHERLFFYWLTLTSHSPYSAKDIHQHNRFSCSTHGLDEDAGLCNNLKLHAQFFDRLAQMLQQPAMRGTRVLLVADHPTPLSNLSEQFNHLNKNHIPYISFVIAPEQGHAHERAQ